jgi:hypothetical protein
MSAKTKRPLSPWIKHVLSVQKANPGMSYKDAMVKAKPSYKGK